MNEKKLRIAVFGSWRGSKAQERIKEVRNLDQIWTSKNNRECFDLACKELGREIARSGHTLLVASDSPSTVDYHVVQGVIEAAASLNATDPPIHVIRSRAPRSSQGEADCSEIMSAAIEEYPNLFDKPEFFNGTFKDTDRSTTKWEQVHDYVTDSADKVLVIGGGAATHRTANRALGQGKLVVPIGTFGGAGEEIIRMLENVRDVAAVPRYDYRQVLGEESWGDSQLNTSLYALGVRKDPNLRRKVFINYRRADSNPLAFLIRSSLLRHDFPEEDVFLDHESIKAGTRFEDVILAELNKTKVFLCVIGPSWLKLRDEVTGQRRLDADEDFVRREIEVALRDGITIIPVFVEGAVVPMKTALPKPISRLTDLNAIFISSNDIEHDIKKLVEIVRYYLND